MKLLRRIVAGMITGMVFTSMAVAQMPDDIMTWATDPAMPVTDQPVTIYVNVNHYGITDLEAVTAYTGTVTTASDGVTGWRNVKNADWNDVSLAMNMENDSIYSYTIDDINAFYGVPATEEVLRLTFIARGSLGGNISGQTSDIFIEVYGAMPTADMPVQTQPAVVKEDGAFVMTFDPAFADHSNSLYTFLNASEQPDTIGVWVHSGVTLAAYSDAVNNWQNVLTDWGENTDETKAMVITPNVVRFYVYPDSRVKYSVEDSLSVIGVNILLRNEDGSAQTSDLFVAFDTTGYNLGLTPVDNVDLSELEGVAVYPNPAKEMLYVRFDQAQSAKITFFNSVGQVLHTEYPENTELVTVNIREFAKSNSMVFYRIESNNKVRSGKVVVY